MIETLPDLAFQAVLVLARIGGAVMLLPGLGAPEVPATIRLALVLALVGAGAAGGAARPAAAAG